MRRAWRWLWRGALGVLVLVVVAVGAGLIALHTAWGREQIRAQVEAALTGTFHGRARVERIEGSVLGTLVAKGVELYDQDDKLVVSARTLRVDVGLLPLLGHTARVEALAADGVTVSVHATTTPPPPPPPGPSEPSAWSVELDDVAVTDATIRIETLAEPITLEGVALRASAVMPAGAPLLAIARVHGTWKERGADFSALAGVRSGDALEVPFAHVDVGGATITAAGVDVDRRVGRVLIAGTRAAIARLAPGVELPGDAVLALDAADAGDGTTRVALRGRVGAARLDGMIDGDVDARTARGVIAATGVELGPITHDRVRGRGTAVLAVAGDATPRAAGALIAAADVEGAPRGVVSIGFDATLARVDAIVLGGADGDTRVAAAGTVVRDGERVTVERAVFGASTRDPEGASAGRAPVRGAIAMSGTARGPVTALEVSGAFQGRALRYDVYGARTVDGTFRATVAAEPSGRAHVAANGVTQAGELLGRATIDARTLAGGRFAVATQAHPAAAPVVVDADAVITPGDVIDIALGHHRVRTPGSTWAGRGGSIRIDDRRIAVRHLVTSCGVGQVEIEATLGRATSTLSATVDARDVPATVIDPAYRGTLNGAVAVERRGVTWSGGGTLAGEGLVLAPDARPLDGEVSLVLDGRRVSLSGKASSAELGGARVALEVDGPRDVTDVAAWRRVPRRDLHAIVVGFDALRPGVTDPRVPGVYDGTLEIRDGKPSGVIHVREVATPVGTAAADVTLALTEIGFVDVNASATAGSAGDAKLTARLAIPERPFDPAMWTQLGRRVIASASARTSEIVIEPRLLAQLGVVTPYRGRATVDVVIGAGAESADVHLDVRDVHGGALAKGVDVDASLHADATDTRAELRASAGALTLLESQDVRAQVPLARWLDDPQAALAAPITGRLGIPAQNAADVLALVGRRDVERGTLAGTAAVAGTVGAPTGTAMVELRDVAVAPRLTRRRPPVLEQLRVTAGWDGAVASLDVTGKEAGKGTLALSARGRPDALDTVTATLTAGEFELAPIAAFLPGALAGASGLFGASLGVRSLDPATMHVRGTLSITDARMPLTPVIGTLRDADAKLSITDRGVTASLDGKIGGGKIAVAANTAAGSRLTTFTAKLTDVAPIGGMQPKITADVRGTLHREGARFTGDATISNTVVRIPAEEGAALLAADAPSDIYFVDQPLPETAAGKQPPARPWLVLDVKLEPARIEAPRYAVVSSLLATAAGDVTVSVGDSIGMDGRIDLDSVNMVLFGHRYTLDEGTVVFDGTTDARFDITLTTDLRDMTMRARLAGRVSELDALEPQLSSEPGTYSQGQLLGFFLGGSPGGDPSEQARDAAVSAGASLASQRVARWIERGLAPIVPLRLDVATCVPRLSDNALTCTFGKWATKSIFVWYDYESQRRIGDPTGSAKLEWHFKPGWTLETAVDLDYGGADLTWRKRW